MGEKSGEAILNSFFIFNHESLPFKNKIDADLKIPEFIKICHSLGLSGIKTALISEAIGGWHSIELSQDYFFRDWLAKAKSDSNLKDLYIALLSIATKSPLIVSEFIEKAENIYVNYNNRTSEVLKAAHIYNSLVASFSTPSWNQDEIRAEVFELTSSDIESKYITICNIHRHEFAKEVISKAKQEKILAIKSGQALLKDSQILFPRLRLCGKSGDQLSTWSNTPACLAQVKEALLSLNIFSEKWHFGTYSDYSHRNLQESGLSHRVTGESESCTDNPKRKNQRTFYISKGEAVLFENHIKISNGNRIYFYAEPNEKFIYVGYIGVHLD